MRKKFIPLAILLVIGMVAVAGYTREKEIIFPEIAALALGAWVMEEPPWRNNPLHLWLSPTVASLTGLAIMKVFPYSPFLMIAGAFILVVIQLKLIGSDVFPSLSAAILPIVTRANSWYYPLSVCILTGIIAWGTIKIGAVCREERADGWALDNFQGKEKRDRLRGELKYLGKLLLGVLLVAAVALRFHLLYMIAPPLTVVFVEMTKPNEVLQAKARLVFTLLGLAAFAGVFWLYLAYYFLHWPVWLSAGLATISVFLFFHYLRLPFPPAAAIVLLPTLLPVKDIWAYPWDVLFGTAAFITISLVWFKKSRITSLDS